MDLKTKNEDLKNIELNKWFACLWYRCIKTEIRYGDKVYTNFRGLNVPEDDIERESFRIISIVSLLVYENKYYLQVYLDSQAYKTIKKQMRDYLDENILEI